jgi:S-adenosylhomocysteine hydrolase
MKTIWENMAYIAMTLIAILIMESLVTTLNFVSTIHQPEAMVTKDGCTIYKWYDKGERMYYTKCEDGTSPLIAR